MDRRGRTERLMARVLAAASAIALSACSNDHGVATGSERDAAPEDSGLDCTTPADGLPADVFCTGLYVGHSSKRHSAEALSYTPGVTLWSDGAAKQRYLQLPAATQVDTSDMDTWRFPVGTKAWKEFRFDDKLVETRLFWKRDETNWSSGTYIWNADETAATLNTSTKPVLLDSGYEIPTSKDCGKCHHGGADKLLGVEAVALALPSAVGVTLTRLVELGALSNPPATTSIDFPEDPTGKAGAALGYLHANCGMPCHSTRGLGEETQLVLRLRAGEFWTKDGQSVASPIDATKTDAYGATVRQLPTTASVAQQFPGADRVTPGAHDQSLIWLLPHRRGKYQMPPLVSHKVDDAGTQLVADWIDAMSP